MKKFLFYSTAVAALAVGSTAGAFGGAFDPMRSFRRTAWTAFRAFQDADFSLTANKEKHK